MDPETPNENKTRRAVSQGQKQALRRWFFSQNPKPSQKDAIEWFERTYGVKLLQSSTSLYLSKSYAYLDSDQPLSQFESGSKKKRPPKYPKLELVLGEWCHSVIKQGGALSNDLIVAMARLVWRIFASTEYPGQEEPEFSEGWMTRFRARNNVKSTVRRGENGATSASVERPSSSIPPLGVHLPEEDLYSLLSANTG